MTLNIKHCLIAGASIAAFLSLSGCGKNDSAVATASAQGVGALPATMPASGFEDAAAVLFTGAFELSAQMISGQKQYGKWSDSVHGGECDGRCSEDNSSDFVPKKFAPYIYNHPLYGGEGENGSAIHLVYVIPATRVSIYLNAVKSDGTANAKVVSQGKEWLLQGSDQIQGDTHILTLSPIDAGAPKGDWRVIYYPKKNSMSGIWSSANGPQTFKASAFDVSRLKTEDDDRPFCQVVGNPSKELIDTTEPREWLQAEIRCVRNLIAAHHGKAFSNPEVRYMFEETDWYIPLRENVDGYNDIELRNLETLKQLEKTAKPGLTTYWG
ncbi:MAG: YARHG domain-containing protein [Formosimonas sp.]